MSSSVLSIVAAVIGVALYGFGFGTSSYNVGAPLSDLNRSYALSDWLFSDFNPGTYDLVTYLTNTITPADIGQVRLIVVPEPSAFGLLSLVGIGVGVVG